MVSNISLKGLSFIILLLILLVVSCNNENSLIINNERGWQSFGLDSIAVDCLVFEDPYLYACAGKKGLWRRNVRITATWEYLGFADTTSGDDYDVGVTEVDVKGNDILVLFSPGEELEYFDTALVGIWRSNDNGKTFIRSDSGIVDDYDNPSHFVLSIGRSYIDPMIGLATRGTHFVTSDGGDTWYPVDDIGYLGPGPEEQKWHPRKLKEVWVYGSGTNMWDFIERSKDGGITNVSLGKWPDEVGGGFSDIGFDAVDTNVAYIATRTLLKTEDDGKNWFYPMSARSISFSRIVTHPLVSNLLYLASENIYRSTDGGESIVSIGRPGDIEVRDMVINSVSNILYIATNKGITKYNP